MTNEQIEELKKLAEAATPDHHIYTNPRDSNQWKANEAWHHAASPAVFLELLSELSTLRAKTACTMGVGTGDGNLFVHGDYESIKAAQALVIRAAASAPKAETDWAQLGRGGKSNMAGKMLDAVLAQVAPVADKTAEYKRMLEDACLDLARINEAVGADPEVGGAGPIIEAIDAMKAKLAAPVAAVPNSPTESMLNAARDWSVKKYGQGIGNDAAIGCWTAMLAAAPAAPVAAAVPAGWVSVDERLPEVPEDDGEEFNITCRRANGKSYVFSAYYLNSKGVISDDDPETVFMGWYLRTEHPDYDGWYTPVCDAGDVVTHWQPLPAAPAPDEASK